MTKSNSNWGLLSIPFNNEMRNGLNTQHQVAQLIAMVGRHLIPQKDDDSNTNMEFYPKTNLLLGNPLPDRTRIGVQLSELKLFLFGRGNEIKGEIPFEGKSMEEIFSNLKESLDSIGVYISELSMEMHYELSDKGLNRSQIIASPEKHISDENIRLRSNAKLILDELVNKYTDSAPVRIWPHHFDTGSIINLTSEISIGIGLAIPDEMIDEPYFYLSYWSDSTKITPKSKDKLKFGKWMMPNWSGATLKLSDILLIDSATHQYDMVKAFFNSGIESFTED